MNPITRFPGFRGMAFFALAYLYVPILVLVAYAFNAGSTIAVWQGFSLKWFSSAFHDVNIQRATVNSLIVAGAATIIATSVATLPVLSHKPDRKDRQGASALVINLPLMVPEVVTAVASLAFFIAIGLPLGLTTLIAAHTVFCIPFAYLPIRAGYDLLDPALEAAARDLYAPPRLVFWKVMLPLMAPGIASGALLAFIVSLDDFVISAMVSGAGSATLPVHIYGMVRHGATPEINAVSTLLLVVSIILVVLSHYLGGLRKQQGRNEND